MHTVARCLGETDLYKESTKIAITMGWPWFLTDQHSLYFLEPFQILGCSGLCDTKQKLFKVACQITGIVI